MATSGSTNFSRNRNEIIHEALELLNVVGAGETASPEDITAASNTLNIMTKAWQAQGRHLWALQEATLLLTKGTESYTLAGARGSNTVVKTELSADEASGQTVISVDSSAGMTAADVVGIELDDGTIHYTTIVSVDSSTQITITDATTGAAAENRHVYTYTTALGRPLRVPHVRLRDSADNDRELEQYSREEYFNLPDKDVQGKPTGYYYDPQLSTGTLYLYPAPDSVKDRIQLTYERAFEDFDGATNDPDFPQEWLQALTWNLALNLAPKYEIAQSKIAGIIAPMAAQALDEVLNYSSEDSQMSIVPDIRIG